MPDLLAIKLIKVFKKKLKVKKVKETAMNIEFTLTANFQEKQTNYKFKV